MDQDEVLERLNGIHDLALVGTVLLKRVRERDPRADACLVEAQMTFNNVMQAALKLGLDIAGLSADSGDEVVLERVNGKDN